MKINWTKYLAITGILSVVLAFVIECLVESVQYYLENQDFVNENVNTGSRQLDINLYGLFKILAPELLFYFFISWITFISLKITYAVFKSSKIKLK